MSRYTIDLSGHTESMLFNYMKKNGIKLKSVGIKKCIEEVNNQENLELKIIEIDNKKGYIIIFKCFFVYMRNIIFSFKYFCSCRNYYFFIFLLQTLM